MPTKISLSKSRGMILDHQICANTVFLPKANLAELLCHLSWPMLDSTYSALWEKHHRADAMYVYRWSVLLLTVTLQSMFCVVSYSRCWLCWSCTCMWYMSSAVSPTELSVRITRFPVSLEVWDDREDDECRTEPSKFSGLEQNQGQNKGIIIFRTSVLQAVSTYSYLLLQVTSGCQMLLKIRPNKLKQIHKCEKSDKKVTCKTT